MLRRYIWYVCVMCKRRVLLVVLRKRCSLSCTAPIPSDKWLEHPSVRMSSLALGSVEKIPNVVRVMEVPSVVNVRISFPSVVNVG